VVVTPFVTSCGEFEAPDLPKATLDLLCSAADGLTELLDDASFVVDTPFLSNSERNKGQNFPSPKLDVLYVVGIEKTEFPVAANFGVNASSISHSEKPESSSRQRTTKELPVVANQSVADIELPSYERYPDAENQFRPQPLLGVVEEILAMQERFPRLGLKKRCSDLKQFANFLCPTQNPLRRTSLDELSNLHDWLQIWQSEMQADQLRSETQLDSDVLASIRRIWHYQEFPVADDKTILVELILAHEPVELSHLHEAMKLACKTESLERRLRRLSSVHGRKLGFQIQIRLSKVEISTWKPQD
jgi:hypothetical protein